jgi:hypothetical protein
MTRAGAASTTKVLKTDVEFTRLNLRGIHSWIHYAV